jgi:hypothetical protein
LDQVQAQGQSSSETRSNSRPGSQSEESPYPYRVQQPVVHHVFQSSCGSVFWLVVALEVALGLVQRLFDLTQKPLEMIQMPSSYGDSTESANVSWIPRYHRRGHFVSLSVALKGDVDASRFSGLSSAATSLTEIHLSFVSCAAPVSFDRLRESCSLVYYLRAPRSVDHRSWGQLAAETSPRRNAVGANDFLATHRGYFHLLGALNFDRPGCCVVATSICRWKGEELALGEGNEHRLSNLCDHECSKDQGAESEVEGGK